MKSYVIKKIVGQPDWSTIESVQLEPLWRDAAGISARAQLCWDDEAIYVKLSATESAIRAEYTGVLNDVCEDSCLEFFLRPTQSLYYFNIEFNPNCALYLGYGSGLHDLVRLIVQDQQALLAPHACRTQDGWQIEYRIPFTFVKQFFPQFAAEEGAEFYGNFYKCGDLTEKEHYLAWNLIPGEMSTYHRPLDFGRLILGGKD